MLLGKHAVQLVLELVAVEVGLAGDGHGLAISRGGVLLDEMLDLVVVDVVCGTQAISWVMSSALMQGALGSDLHGPH